MMVHQGTVDLVDRRHRAHAVANGRRLLGLEPDHEAGAIHQVNNRQMEGLGEVDPADHLVAGIGRPRSAIVERIARQHQNRAAFQPGKPGDDRTAEIGVDLEERALVDDGVDDRAHLVDLAAIARHHLEQQFLRALRIVRCRAWSAAGRTPTTANRTGSAWRARTPPPQCRPHRRRHRRGSGCRRRRVRSCSGPGRGASPPGDRRQTSQSFWS